MLKSWLSPAKINLFLHITGRRTNGYHDLQTIFQFLNLCDEIKFNVRLDGQIRRTSELTGVAPEQDLVVKAAKALQLCTNTPLGVDIHVVKRLPMGGGLGGGSSNAATTLVALNQLWNLQLSTTDLQKIGVKIGADVPIFIYGQAAWAEGVGENLTPVELEQAWYLVIHPKCHVPTAEIFCAPELTRDSQPITMRDFLAHNTRNDCEPVVCSRFPQVKQALTWLREHCSNGRLTGTGACVYCEFADQSSAEQMLSRVPSVWHSFVAQGLNKSPLY